MNKMLFRSKINLLLNKQIVNRLDLENNNLGQNQKDNLIKVMKIIIYWTLLMKKISNRKKYLKSKIKITLIWLDYRN